MKKSKLTSLLARVSGFCAVLLGCGNGVEGGSSGGGGAGAMAGTGGASTGGTTETGGMGSGGTSGSGSGGMAGSSGGSASTSRCAESAPFGEPAPIIELNTGLPETGARLTSNELVIVFERDGAIFLAQRADRSQPFGEAGEVNLPVSGSLGAPWISDDRLTLLFEVDNAEIRICTRADPSYAFRCGGTPTSSNGDPFVVGAGNGRLYAAGNGGIEVAPLSNWNPGLFEPLGIAGGIRPVPMPDELTLFLGWSNDTWVTRRASTSKPFPDLVATGVKVAGASATVPSWVSPDGCRLYVDTWYDAGADLYVAERQ